MKKLTKNSSVGDFYDKAHYLMLQKEGRFTIQQVYEEILEGCDENVSFNFIKPIVLEVLDNLLNKGLIKYIDEGVGVFYQSSLTENIEQSV